MPDEEAKLETSNAIASHRGDSSYRGWRTDLLQPVGVRLDQSRLPNSCKHAAHHPKREARQP